jgi:hypothetical protein
MAPWGVWRGERKGEKRGVRAVLGRVLRRFWAGVGLRFMTRGAAAFGRFVLARVEPAAGFGSEFGLWIW